MKTKALFGGKATIQLEEIQSDPLHILEPKEVIAGYYGIFDLKVPYEKVIYKYRFQSSFYLNALSHF